MAVNEFPSGVISRRRALRLARRLGLDVSANRGTGEVRVRAADGRNVNHNNRRKDASRALLCLLREAAAAQAARSRSAHRGAH